MSNVWLITGSSRGLGRAIAEAVLAAGDHLVATARDPETLADLAARYPATLRTAPLDVTDPAAAQAAVALALDAFGRLDVLVNNAGYGHIAPFEQMDPEAFRAQMDTNFYGVVNLTRAALPAMRRQGSGHILQISSVGGRIGNPGLSAYQSAKWAVGGFTEVLAQELAPLGIRVTTLEPGGMRTNWGFTAKGAVPELLPGYQPSVGALLTLLEGIVGQENSDPAKVAAVVLQLARHPNPPVHLLLGSDALHYAGLVEADRDAAAERWGAVSRAVDMTAPAALPVFPRA
jgi:NAD(P)-dependent dehydrogenase (short-subunit alcohol dehydrogenase family)